MKNLEKPVLKRDKKQNIRTLKRLYHYVKTYRLFLLTAIVLTVLSNLSTLAAPKLVERCIQRIESTLPKIDLGGVLEIGIFMILFYLGTYVLSIFLSRTMLKLGQHLGYDLRKAAFAKFDRLPVSYFDTHQTGDTISRFTYDVDMISSSIGQTYVSFATSMITLVGSFLMMISQNIGLMASFVITVPLSFFFASYVGTKTRVYNREKSKKTGELNGFVEDKITGHKTVKVYSQQSHILAQFYQKNEAWGDAHYAAEAKGRGILISGTQFITQIATILIYLQSAYLLYRGRITLAEIASFVLYAKMFTEIVNELSYLIADLQTSLATADRVFDLIDEPEEKEDGADAVAVKVQDLTGQVSFRQVDFRYDSNRNILQDINIQVPPNSVVAIVGHTGAGKTTLINLLMRFYHVQQGGIYFDGMNIEDMKAKSLRKACAMVLQDTWLFHGSIFENIAYGKVDATLEDVIAVAKAVSIHDYITSLPEGYHTILTEDSVNISQGQKQLLTIARAMLLDAKILILDEATSNVDTLTEVTVQQSMMKLMRNKTTFVIAHRLSTIKNADLILLFEKGKIQERGTHQELMNLNQQYTKLYNSQFEQS